jgi:L-threonylcarbamoyladenylate synthase
VAFATETVYGLGALATDPAAVARIFAAKGRPSFNPLIIHVAGIDQARGCVQSWPQAAGRLARTFWPGPLTLVLPRSRLIPDIVTGGRDTVGLRVPAAEVARRLIQRLGQPLAAPSANRSNHISPTRAEHVLAGLDGAIDLVLDSGPTNLGLESTVLDLTSSPIQILRPGPVDSSEIGKCLGTSDPVTMLMKPAQLDEPPASPGMLPVHYAPRTPALRVESAGDLVRITPAENTAILALGQHSLPGSIPSDRSFVLADPREAARQVYAALHHLDALGLERIVVLMPPDRPEWTAIRDRMLKATRPAMAD